MSFVPTLRQTHQQCVPDLLKMISILAAPCKSSVRSLDFRIEAFPARFAMICTHMCSITVYIIVYVNMRTHLRIRANRLWQITVRNEHCHISRLPNGWHGPCMFITVRFWDSDCWFVMTTVMMFNLAHAPCWIRWRWMLNWCQSTP